MSASWGPANLFESMVTKNKLMQGCATRVWQLLVLFAMGGASGFAHADVESQHVAPDATDTPASEEVVVTGKRASLATAQAIKREKLEIVDSVVADDINKLPDNSVAEAMQRITGVQMAHDRGEGSANQSNFAVNDARLSPGITIRGLPMVETLFNGREVFTAGRGRTFNFADIPAEMVSAIHVYKTSSADHIEGGVGGLVDLRTRRPFDFSGREVSVKVGAMRGDLAEEIRPQFSLLASNRVETDIGELGALINVGYQKRAFREEYVESGTRTTGGVSLPTGWAETTNVGERTRYGASIILEWRPTDRAEWYAELHHSQFKTLEDAYQLFITNGGAASNIVLFPGTGHASSVTWATATGAVFAADRDTMDRNTQVAVGGSWVGDALTLKADLSHTRSYNSLTSDAVFMTGATATGFTHNVAHTPATATFATSNPGFTASAPSYAFVPFAGELAALQLDGEYQLSGKLIDALSAGIRYTERQADNARGQLSLTNPIRNPLGTWEIEEKTQSTYVMARLKATGIPLDGNIGVRMVRTKEKQRGFEGTSNADAEPVSLDRTYVDTLPSVNLRYELSPGLYLRGAASKSVTRPDFNKMSPSLTLNSVLLLTGGAGNPDLRPTRSENFDLALEKYISKTTSVYLTGFKKNVDGFVSDVTNPEVHDGLVYQITRPFNTGASKISGFEVGYQQFYDFLPGWLGGLGLQLNYTYVDSDVEDSNLPLAGLSQNSYNVIGMYEKGPVSARIAYTWRDQYLTRVLSGTPIYMDSYGWLDASLHYRLSDRVSISLEGLNLLGTTRNTYYEEETRPQISVENDRYVGVTMTVRF